MLLDRQRQLTHLLGWSVLLGIHANRGASLGCFVATMARLAWCVQVSLPFLTTSLIHRRESRALESLGVKEDVVVVRGDSPVLTVIVFLWEIFLVVCEECVQLNALLEVLDSLHTSDLLQEIEVSVDVNAGTDESMPVDALDSDVGVVLLELEVDGLVEIDVRALDSVHVVTRHLELVEVEVLGEDLHLLCYFYYY